MDTKGPKAASKDTGSSSGPDWVKRGPRQAGHRALLAAAVSDDGHYLAVGGGDWRVHVWDIRSNEYIQVQMPAFAHGIIPHAAESRSQATFQGGCSP